MSLGALQIDKRGPGVRRRRAPRCWGKWMRSAGGVRAARRDVDCLEAGEEKKEPEDQFGQISASPTAWLLRGYRRAGAQNDRLVESFPAVRDACPLRICTHEISEKKSMRSAGGLHAARGGADRVEAGEVQEPEDRGQQPLGRGGHTYVVMAYIVMAHIVKA